jgi:hypothetical protein
VSLHWWQHGINKDCSPRQEIFWGGDIREFLRDFEIYVAVNEWSDEKAGQFLAVFLTDDATAFYHPQQESVRKSYKELSGALKERYEGGLALLKYKKVFNGRCRKSGATLHSYLSELRLAYERTYSPPTVDPLPEGASAEAKNERFKQEGALAFYNKRKNEDVLCQFINGLDKDLKEVLIRQDDLLERPVGNVSAALNGGPLSLLNPDQPRTQALSTTLPAGGKTLVQVGHVPPSFWEITIGTYFGVYNLLSHFNK